MKLGGSTAERAEGIGSADGSLVAGLLQHKEMDTNMLESPTMTLQTERGKFPRF